MMKKIISCICMIMIFIGMCMLIYNAIKDEEYKRQDAEKIEEFFNNYNEEKKEEVVDDKTEVNKNSNLNFSYISVIEIPNISLKTGIVMSDISYKSMDRNVSIFPNSDMPDVIYGNFILFAHNGNSRISYFRNIHKLENGNDIFIYYNNKKYNYKVINKYDINMNSNIPLNKTKGKTTITLITCNKDNNKYRTIVVGELINDR